MIIPVKNGGADLRRCLDAIAGQRIDEETEVVVVDSGSSDGSGTYARSRGARVHVIAAGEFNHGATRNLGAGLARGEVLVFTSQDAYAADEHWLARLTAPLRTARPPAGVYGRQVAHHDAAPPEHYFLDFLYGPVSREQSAGGPHELSLETTLFSNVNAAIPRSLFERFGFVDDIIMSEDQEWARRVLLAGHEIHYVAEAAVRHSHPYSLVEAFRRFFDSGVSAERSYLSGAGPSGAVLRRAALRYATGELRWLWRSGQGRWIPYAAVYESAKFAGLQLGARHRLLPLELKLRCTALPAYWTAPAGGRLPDVGTPASP